MIFAYNEKDYLELHNYFNGKTEYELIMLRNLRNSARNRMKNFMLLGGLIAFCFEQLFIVAGLMKWVRCILFISIIIIFISFVFIIKRLERLELETLVIDHVLNEKD